MIEKQKAVIVVGHGSRKDEARSAFLEVITLVKKRLKQVRIEPAFLEFSSQDIPSALEKLVQEGYKEIVLFPLFLFRGIHVGRDIPDLIKKGKEKFSGINIILTSPLWPDERIAEITVDHIKEIF